MAEHQPPKDSRDDDPSLLENLKQAGGALGGVVSEFTGNYRADREAVHDQGGEHALDDPDEEEGTVAEQLRAAGAEARQKYAQGSGFGAVRDAAGALAGRAGGIVRDVAGSATRAADATRESEVVGEAASAVSGAWSSVRGRMDGAVSSVRGRLDRDKDGQDDDMADEGAGNIIEGEVISSETTETPNDKEK